MPPLFLASSFFGSKQLKAPAPSAVEYPSPWIFTWKVKNFSTLETKIRYSNNFLVNDCKMRCSDNFLVDDCQWRVKICLKRVTGEDSLSLYLEVPESNSLPDGWSRDVKFSLVVVDQLNPEHTLIGEVQNRFNAKTTCWGYSSFMPLTKLKDPTGGYVVDDTCAIQAEVSIQSVVPRQRVSLLSSVHAYGNCEKKKEIEEEMTYVRKESESSGFGTLWGNLDTDAGNCESLKEKNFQDDCFMGWRPRRVRERLQKLAIGW